MIGRNDALQQRSDRRIALGLALWSAAVVGLGVSAREWTGLAPLVFCPIASACLAAGVFPSKPLRRILLATSFALVNAIVFPKLSHFVQQHRFGITSLPGLLGFHLAMLYVGPPATALLAGVLRGRRKA